MPHFLYSLQAQLRGITLLARRPGRSAPEWDVLPFSVRERIHGDTFLSTVDLLPSRSSSAQLVGDERPCVVAFANNWTTRFALTNYLPAPPPVLKVLRLMTERLSELSTGASRTSAMILSGGGWSFEGDIAWLNRAFFPGDNSAISRGLIGAGYGGGPTVEAPLPGESIVMEGRQIVARGSRNEAFIKAAAPGTWPDRRYERETPRVTRVEALLGDRPFAESELEMLRSALKVFAHALVGSTLFLGLNSLKRDELSGLIRAYVLFAQTDGNGEGYVFEYSPAIGDFIPAEHPLDAYAAGATCWAADLLAALTGRITGPTLVMGRLVEWVKCKALRPEALSLATELWAYGHPLRMADEYFALYRSLSANRVEGALIPHAC